MLLDRSILLQIPGRNFAFVAILWHFMIHTSGVHADVRNLWSWTPVSWVMSLVVIVCP